MDDNDWQPRREVHCPNCGAPNPAGAPYCTTCGSRFPTVDAPDEETLIDVSGGHPQILVEERPGNRFGGGTFQGGFTTVRIDQGRVFVTQGNRRTCLIVSVVALLLFCCACWFIGSIPSRLF